MKQFDDIEELFKNGLDNLEVEPAPGTWQAIQSRIPASSAGAAGSLTSGKIFIAAGLIAVSSAAVFLINGSNEPANLTTGSEKTIVQDKEQNENIIAENLTPEKKEGEESKPALIEDKKPTSLTKTNTTRGSYSIVNGFMTKQSEKESLLRNNYNKSANKTTAPEVENPIVKINEPVVQNTEQEVTKPVSAKIIADKTSGTAPLKIQLKNSTEANAYEWIISDGSSSFEEVAEITFDTPGIYQVTLKVKDKTGNSYTDRINIEVIEESEIGFVNQNIFTPNGDGTNDVFRFECRNIEKFQVHIVNAQGDIVFQSSDPDFKWDGFDATGVLCPKGVYYYTVAARGSDGKEHQHLRKPLVLQ